MQDQISQLYTNTLEFINKSAETAQNAYNQLMDTHDTEKRKAEFEAQVGKILERVAENLHIATTRQLQELQERVQKLEAEIADMKAAKAVS